METSQEERKILPDELNHLEQPLKDAKGKIQEIDRQIDQLGPDTGPQYAYRPPNYGSPSFGNPTHIESNADKKVRLNSEKSRIGNDFKELLEKETSNLDPDKAKKVKEVVDYHLSNNQFNTGIPQKDAKHNEVPFDKIQSLYYERYSFDTQQGKSGATNKEASKSGTASKNTPERYMAQYDVSNTKDFSGKDEVDKTQDSEPNKNEIGKSETPTKNTPESYMAQYDYPQAKDFEENTKEMTEKKDLAIEVDKDRD